MIYIGIPAHDERHTIGPLLWRIRELLYGERREFHVLVCDDASRDGTRDTLEEYSRVLPLTLIVNESRRGYAASLERIVRATVERSSYPRRDALVTMQGDFSDPPERLPDMLRRFDGGADMVTFEPPASESRERRWTRRCGRLLASSLSPSAAVGDPFTSFRLYRLFALERALAELAPEARLLSHRGWAADSELLLRVSPFLRRAEAIERSAEPTPERRYRESRFRMGRELRRLFRAGRDPSLRELGRVAREAA
ncbi:MAG: glycosyltransferase family 2 protein [Gemmatimonadota bacterium]|nr:glycosyltransferase family 2 protein [Gemmatimonadota bacterium]